MKTTSSRHRLPRLTPTEMRVCHELVYSPHSFKEIAAHLGRSYHTIRTQCERIYRKLNVRSRAELVAQIRGSSEDAPTNQPATITLPASVSPITKSVARNCRGRKSNSSPCPS